MSLLVLSACLVLAPPKPILLRFVPVIGKTYRYKVVSNSLMELHGGKSLPFRRVGIMTMRATKRDKTGTTVITKLESMVADVQPSNPIYKMAKGMEAAAKGSVSTIVMGLNGKALSIASKGKARAAAEGIMSSFQGVSFPTGPVKVGGTWKSSVDMGKLVGGMDSGGPAGAGLNSTGVIPIVSKLTDVKKTPDHGMVAHITSTMNGDLVSTMGNMHFSTKMRGSGDIVAEIASGMPVSVVSTQVGYTTMNGQSFVVKATLKMDLTK